MKKIIFLIALLSSNIAIYAQTKKINSIGISVPVIWNKSSGVYYQLGNRKEPEGKGRSAGIGINYSRSIYKNVFGMVGFGYFKQNFSISRPFDFKDPNNLLFTTKSYSYNNLNFSAGAGYLTNLNTKFILKNYIILTKICSYKQGYIPKFLSNFSTQTSQTNNKFLNIGNMIDYGFGLGYKLNNKFNISLGCIIPLKIKWNSDNTFFEYSYSHDTQIIAYNKSSIGGILTINYNIK